MSLTAPATAHRWDTEIPYCTEYRRIAANGIIVARVVRAGFYSSEYIYDGNYFETLEHAKAACEKDFPTTTTPQVRK
jgi:hypothetical protein